MQTCANMRRGTVACRVRAQTQINALAQARAHAGMHACAHGCLHVGDTCICTYKLASMVGAKFDGFTRTGNMPRRVVPRAA